MRQSEIIVDGLLCVLVEDLHHFDLQQIMESGQCFRIQELPVNGSNILRSHSVSWHEHVKIDTLSTPGSFIFHCNMRQMKKWSRYFNLDMDYYEMVKSILAEHPDPFLEKALEYGSGIRILRQGIYEAILAFMISQNNNISRITKSLDMMHWKYGVCRDDRGIRYNPTLLPSELVGKDFTELGLGYREQYFREMFAEDNYVHFMDWISAIVIQDYAAAKRGLMQAKGIGTKVADCICLYGLHHMEAYPIDTWMKKLIENVYDGHFDVTPYQKCAGYVQQLQFYYYRSLGGENHA